MKKFQPDLWKIWLIIEGIYSCNGNGNFDELKKIKKKKNHFTIGINDDVTFTSLKYNKNFLKESDEVFRAMFYGLGADGTVYANKTRLKS